MKIKIEVRKDHDTEQRVWMRTDVGGVLLGASYPGKRDTDPKTSRAKLRALKDARATTRSAYMKLDRMVSAEEGRLATARQRR